jgi:hypothetical protein
MALEIGAVADGAIKQQAAIASHADAVVSDTQPATQIPFGKSNSIGTEIADVWRQHNQSHFGRALTGIYRRPE